MIHTHTHTHRQTDTHTDTQTHTHKHTQTHTHTNTHRHTHTHTLTHTHTQSWPMAEWMSGNLQSSESFGFGFSVFPLWTKSCPSLWPSVCLLYLFFCCCFFVVFLELLSFTNKWFISLSYIWLLFIIMIFLSFTTLISFCLNVLFLYLIIIFLLWYCLMNGPGIDLLEESYSFSYFLHSDFRWLWHLTGAHAVALPFAHSVYSAPV